MLGIINYCFHELKISLIHAGMQIMINATGSDVTAVEGDIDQQQICVETMGVGVLTTPVIVAFALSGDASMFYLIAVKVIITIRQHFSQYFFLCLYMSYFNTALADIQGFTVPILEAGVNDPSSCALFTILDDDILEGDHELTFTIFDFIPASEIAIRSPRAHVFTIKDNEGTHSSMYSACIPIYNCNHRFSCNCNARRNSLNEYLSLTIILQMPRWCS